MPNAKQAIIDEIAIQCDDIPYSDCYVGITSNIAMRLLDHNVSVTTDRWICRMTSSAELAREIQQHFMAAGMDGSESGRNEQCKIVYVYRKSATTVP
jgi:hypothetical protein